MLHGQVSFSVQESQYRPPCILMSTESRDMQKFCRGSVLVDDLNQLLHLIERWLIHQQR